MKKKTLIIIAILVVIALFAGLIIPMLSKDNSGNNTENNSETASSEDTDSTVQKSTELQTKDIAAADETKADQESENTEKENDIETGSTPGGGGSAGGSAGGSSGNSGGNDSNDKESQPATSSQTSGESTPDIPEISFPYTISESNLVVEQIRSYSGYFIEDASDKEVSGVAAIVLTNNGKDDLEFAGIGISQGTRSLGFSASQIPAGATVIILEQNGASFSSDPYYSATATTTPVEKFEMSEELVTVKDNGDNSLIVSNISDKTLSEVKIFFKNYLADEDVYVGGITYTITMSEDLEPGTSIGVSASHYDSKFSKVVEVQAKK